MGMGKVVDVLAIGPAEVWVAMATGGRDARWVRNIAASCGFLPPDSSGHSKSTINDNFKGRIQVN